MKIRVLFTGGRTFADRDWVYNVIRRYTPENTLIIHGAAPGLDTIVDEIATELGFEIKRYPADWERHQKAAGSIRNREMFFDSKPDVVNAFPGGPGTKNMVSLVKLWNRTARKDQRKVILRVLDNTESGLDLT
jgi:predicted Rossmann-fold nucleotide-binding protein